MVVSLHQSDIKQLSATALLFASWVNMGLYGVELVLCAYCLGWHCCMDNLPAGPTNTSGSPILQSNGDLRWVRKQSRLKRVGSKWFIIGALVNDTICTVALCLDTYFIVRFSNSSESMSSNNRLWPTALWILTTSLATTFEQTYFLHRYWTISKNWIITTTLAGLILCNFIFILIIDAAFIPTSNNSLILEKLDAPLHFTGRYPSVETQVREDNPITNSTAVAVRLIRKICIFVVGYGCITAASSALMLVMWVVNVNGRVYSLTVLCNFLFVSGWRNEAATADFHGELDSNLTVKASELDQIPWFKLTAPSGLPTRNSSPLHQMQPPSNQTVIAQKDMLAPSFSVDTL
ncbi:hypothetical protein DFH05DRAFT_1461534 [Lentinula detonsa]|uniref:Transmembrane protein n=1 Tax=Lentinula detonsa TaxID=2804962 RepID=A0A9W8TVP8_9AGAR|nr:hypothetical protein DFH05DRAFT_1461534 [Lentinula detonsa]